MNPFLIAIGAMILFVGLHAEIDWYKRFGKFYFQDNGGGSLIVVGVGVMAIIMAFFLPDMPEYTADPIEIIKEGGHR